jgi:O-antigen ligase
MKPSGANASSWNARAGAAAVAVALGLAVFYHGPQLALWAGAQAALIAWLALSLVVSYANGIRAPITPLSVSLTLFWSWLGATLWWTRVPVTSDINFWWIGTPVLVYWCYTLAPDRAQVWRYLTRVLPLGALALCALAWVQVFLWHEPARATFINVHSFAALLILIAFPLTGRFLRAQRDRARALIRWGTGACLFVLFFTVALTEGRGTAISLILSAVVFAALAVRSVGARPLAAWFGVIVIAYIAANLALHGGFSDARLLTLGDPESAGVPRFLIWRGAWEMLLAKPWWGIGLGTYYLAWPPYRDPADASLGFFVHNDYLQIWIEAGLPALLLLLAAFGAVGFMLARLLRRRPPADVRLETVGLFSGMLAIAIHSTVDFDFYILPIGILLGLALGRFEECVGGVVAPREARLRPARFARRAAFVAVVMLLAFAPISYFGSVSVSDQLFKRGLGLAMIGKLRDADAAFTWSERLLSYDDKVLVTHADLYRQVLHEVAAANETERRSLYEAALAMLDEAETANPYRPLNLAVRAQILEENPDLSGPDWRGEAEGAYARALALDPRFINTRMAYARLLLSAGRAMEAYGVLDAGMVYWYAPGVALLRYYDFTARLARQNGQNARAAAIEGLSAELRRATSATAVPRSAAIGLPLPIGAAAD